MMSECDRRAGMRMRKLRSGALALLISSGGVAQLSVRQDTANAQESKSMTKQTKFYCNIKALNATERAHHKELTDKLVAERQLVVETEKGYEFQFSPPRVSLAELAEWVSAESKCCPFFDFHIDLEREGSLLCLRLAGAEGIKLFIRSEFQVAAR